MENLEKIELVREKCGVGYEAARDALEASGWDVLEAIVALEREGIARSAAEAEEALEPEVELAGDDGAEAESAPRAGGAWARLVERCKAFVRATSQMAFVAERGGEAVVSVPLLVVIVGMLVWGATLWLMVVGLFFGFRYRIEGEGKLVEDVNGAMGKAAEVADDVRGSVA